MIRLPINFELYWGQFCALKIEAGPKKGRALPEQLSPPLIKSLRYRNFAFWKFHILRKSFFQIIAIPLHYVRNIWKNYIEN